MPLPKLALDIDEGQYSVSPGSEVEEVKVEAGTAWRRKDYFGAPNQVSLKMVLGSFAFDYFMAFYRTTLSRGLLPFLIDLVIDRAGMKEYQAVIVGGNISVQRSGDAHTVTATLEVKRAPDEAANDAQVLTVYGAFGDYTESVLNMFDHLANVAMPMSLHP